MDIREAKHVRITIRDDARTVWIHVENGPVMRIGHIEELEIVDQRPPTQEAQA